MFTLFCNKLKLLCICLGMAFTSIHTAPWSCDLIQSSGRSPSAILMRGIEQKGPIFAKEDDKFKFLGLENQEIHDQQKGALAPRLGHPVIDPVIGQLTARHDQNGCTQAMDNQNCPQIRASSYDNVWDPIVMTPVTTLDPYEDIHGSHVGYLGFRPYYHGISHQQQPQESYDTLS